MPRRTTILLDDDIYKMLIEESLKRYTTTKAISKVINELLKESLKNKINILDLIFSKKIVKMSAKEFEKFRRELSTRLES
jgi:predicted CopG family antitoxin